MIAESPRGQLLDTAAELQRVTEAAAVAAAPWIGAGVEYKNEADRAAVDAMHRILSLGSVACRVAIGEGVKDGAPILEHGRVYGPLGTAALELAVDPIEGTSFVARGEPGGMAIAALGEAGTFPQWSGIPYMRKLVVGPEAADLLDEGIVRIDGDPAENMLRVAEALDKPVTDLRVAVLDRPRNAEIIQAAERLGVPLILLKGGDVLPAMQICFGEGDVDMLYSSGGAPEAVLTATFVAIMDGNMQVMWDPQNKEEAQIAEELGQLDTVISLRDLTGDGELHFSATGITGSSLMEGCRQENGVWQPGCSITASRARNYSRVRDDLSA